MSFVNIWLIKWSYDQQFMWDLQLATLSRRKYFAGVMVSREGQLLLGMKKRGFGRCCLLLLSHHSKNSRGLWQHSFCGKLEKGESIAEAAVRELEEESGLQVLETYIFAVEFYLGKH